MGNIGLMVNKRDKSSCPTLSITSTIIAVDQSSKRTGIAVVNGHRELLYSTSLAFSAKLSHRERRAQLASLLRRLVCEYEPELVVVEFVRIFAEREGGAYKGHSRASVRVLTKMVGSIVDAVAIPVYSIDTLAWQRAVLVHVPVGGTSKDRSVWYAKNVYNADMNDDEADALCLGIAAFDSSVKKLKED